MIDGVPYDMSPAPNRKHQSIAINLSSVFRNYLKEKKCKVYAAPFDIRLSKEGIITDTELVETVLQPDIVIYCNKEQLDKRGGFGAPELVVEILSESTEKKDRTIKKKIYEDFGVREFWLIDPVYETVSVFLYSTKNQIYNKPKKYENNQSIRVKIFPDLIVDLKEVFEE